MLTVLPLSAVPVSMGVESLVTPSELAIPLSLAVASVMVGAAGALLSST
jgi:hypothetical protein